MLWTLSLVLVAAALLVLAAPVSLAFELHRRQSLRGHAQLRMLYGLVRKRFEWGAEAREQGLAQEAPKRRRHRTGRGASSRKGASPGRVLDGLRAAGLWEALGRFLRRLTRAVRFGRWSARVRFGLEDPADTGMLWGLLGPLTLVVQQARGADVEVGPVFDAARLDVDAKGSVAVVPLELLAVSLAFLLAPATLRAGYVMLGKGKR